jgi:RNA polymerase sigma factor (sigma-70 family)
VVLAAQGESPAAEKALEKLCLTYWRPVYSFIRRQGRGTDEAEDLTQSFFTRLLERRDLNSVRREKGRLRSYLLIAAKHFLASERERATSARRGGGLVPIPLEEMRAHEGNATEPVDILTADRIYERRWALTVLDQALARLSQEYCPPGNQALFDQLKRLLTDEPDRPSQAQIANELGMSENAVKQAYHRFRLAYRECVREEIAQTVAVPGDIEDELRHHYLVTRFRLVFPRWHHSCHL